jgi:hypothetical protein
VTVYVNYPSVEVVVTDEGAFYPSYVGASNTAATTVDGNITFGPLTLTGSDGEVAQASGAFGLSPSGLVNAVNLTLTGGIGYSGQVLLTTSQPNSLYAGSYSGTFTSTYSAGLTAATEPTGTITSLTIAADSNTGGYDLNATGSTFDPIGNAVNFTISNAQVDPCGIISKLSIIFTYTDGTTPSVTNTYSSAYLNLGVVANTTLVGYLNALTPSWTIGTFTEADTLNLTKSVNPGIQSKASSSSTSSHK